MNGRAEAGEDGGQIDGLCKSEDATGRRVIHLVLTLLKKEKKQQQRQRNKKKFPAK